MNKKGATLIYLITTIVLALLLFIPIAYWTDSNLDFWISFLKKSTVNIPFWMSYIVTVFCNGFIIPINIILSLLKYVI